MAVIMDKAFYSPINFSMVRVIGPTSEWTDPWMGFVSITTGRVHHTESIDLIVILGPGKFKSSRTESQNHQTNRITLP